MPIIQALIEARKKMPALTEDKVASIPTKTGKSYSFKYSSLHQILKTITDSLLEQGIYVTQSVGSLLEAPNVITLQTCLTDSTGETLQSEVFHIITNGTASEVGGRITTARRQQLTALLCLSPGDEEDPINETAVAYPRTAPAMSDREVDEMWESAAPLRKAVTLSKAGKGRSSELGTLIARLKQDDLKGGNFMDREPAEGKKISPYHYLLSKMQVPNINEAERVLSYLYQRVVTEDNPPYDGSNWFVKEVVTGKHDGVIEEAVRLSQES